jgi:hypothetical protein
VKIYPALAALLFSLFSMAAPAAAGSPIALAPTKGVSVHQDFIDAVNALALNTLEEAKEEVIDLTSLDAENFLDVATKEGAQRILRLDMIRLGERVKLSARLMNSSGETIARQSLAAGTPDDLDKVVARLIRAVISGQLVNENQSIYDVTEEEEARLKKKQATNYFGLTLGALTHFATPGDEDAFNPGLGVFWLYDPRTFLAEIDFHWYIPKGDSTSINLGLSGYYPLTRGDICPYVGGGLSFAVRASDNSAGDNESGQEGYGLSANIGAGILMGRTSSVTLRADIRFFQDTFKTGNTAANGLTYNIGIGF